VVARSGSLTGDVKVARLVIQDGASFSGNVSMGPQHAAAARPPEPVPSQESEPAPSGNGNEKQAPPKGKPKR